MLGALTKYGKKSSFIHFRVVARIDLKQYFRMNSYDTEHVRLPTHTHTLIAKLK